MSEEETPVTPPADPAEPSTDNIPAADGGETTTPEEVAQLLNLPTPKEKEDDEDEDDEKEKPKEGEEQETEEEKTAREAKEADEAKAAEDTKLAEEEAAKKAEDAKGDDEAPDFSLEVTDANGDKFTLKPDDNLEEVLKDFEPKNNGQIFQVLKDLGKLEQAKTNYEADQAEQTAETEKQERITSIQAGWEKEIETLQGSKRIPTTATGKDNERVNEVFKYINEENNKRLEDGRPLLNSFEDALDKLELKETKEAAIKKDKEEKELAKQRGGIVGGSSAPASSGPPTYKGGARNANEAIRQMGLVK